MRKMSAGVERYPSFFADVAEPAKRVDAERRRSYHRQTPL